MCSEPNRLGVVVALNMGERFDRCIMDLLYSTQGQLDREAM